jgi:hypothetical protein
VDRTGWKYPLSGKRSFPSCTSLPISLKNQLSKNDRRSMSSISMYNVGSKCGHLAFLSDDSPWSDGPRMGRSSTASPNIVYCVIPLPSLPVTHTHPSYHSFVFHSLANCLDVYTIAPTSLAHVHSVSLLLPPNVPAHLYRGGTLRLRPAYERRHICFQLHTALLDKGTHCHLDETGVLRVVDYSTTNEGHIRRTSGGKANTIECKLGARGCGSY